MARAASASVSADAIRRPLLRTAVRASMSRSSSAATNALDSMYRIPARALASAVPAAAREGLRPGRRLDFATIVVNQLGGGSSRKCNVRPVFGRVAGFQGGRITPEATRSSKRLGVPFVLTRRDKLRNHPAMCRDRDTFARLNTPNVAAQIVFQFANTCRGHRRL